MVLEARLVQGAVLKKIVESIKDLVTDANLDCAETGITLQVRPSTTPAHARRKYHNIVVHTRVARICKRGREHRALCVVSVHNRRCE